MKVILQEKIGHLGNVGDQVTVKAGYGRNFLIPRGKAVQATPSNIEQFEKRRAQLEKAAADVLASAKARADKLSTLTVSVEANASDEGKLFGSIGPRDVADAICNAGVEVEKSEVSMPEGPIRMIGEYDIALQLHSDVEATVKLHITEAK